RHEHLSARYAKLQPLYDLSYEIISSYGYGYGYGEGALHAPGFVIKTWQTWQYLCFLALQAGLRGLDVRETPRIMYGRRSSSEFSVHPDVLITTNNGNRVVDAKY